MLRRAVGQQPQSHVKSEEACGQRHEEDELHVIPHDEDAGQQRAGRGIKEDAHQQPLIIIVRERPPVAGSDFAIADLPVLRQPLDRHQKRTGHPVGEDQRDRWDFVDDQCEPAEKQPQRVVDRLGQHVDVGDLLRPDRGHVVQEPHQPEPQPRQPEIRVDQKGQAQPDGPEHDPLDQRGNGTDHAGGGGPRPFQGVAPIGGRIDQLVQDVVARGDDVGREHSDHQYREARPGPERRTIEDRQHDTEPHEGALEPVIDAGDLDVRADPCQRTVQPQPEGPQGTGMRGRYRDAALREFHRLNPLSTSGSQPTPRHAGRTSSAAPRPARTSSRRERSRT